MPTDQEIIAFVAQHVMGWRWFSHADYWADESGDATAPLSWSPLTSWADAGELLERCAFSRIIKQDLRKFGGGAIPRGPGGATWDVLVTIGPRRMDVSGIGIADSGPRAITWACYRATGGVE